MRHRDAYHIRDFKWLRRCGIGALILAVVSFAAPIEASDFDVGKRVIQRVERVYGVEARRRVERWRNLISELRDHSERDTLEAVNRFFNDLRFVPDLDHWGRSDYWATPLEFLGTNGGDCEDFSVAKYVSLKELGVPEERLNLTYVKSLKLDQAHMVVTYFPSAGGEPLVLDNIIKEIKPASMRKDLLPVYSLSGDGLWLAKERGRGKFIGNSNRIATWKGLNDRMMHNRMNTNGH